MSDPFSFMKKKKHKKRRLVSETASDEVNPTKGIVASYESKVNDEFGYLQASFLPGEDNVYPVLYAPHLAIESWKEDA